MHNSIDIHNGQATNVIPLPTRQRYGSLSADAVQSLTSLVSIKVLAALAMHAGTSSYCWPSVPRLMLETNLSERGVYKGLAQLKELGFISVHEQGWILHNRERANCTPVQPVTARPCNASLKKRKRENTTIARRRKRTMAPITNITRSSDDDERPVKAVSKRAGPSERRTTLLNLATKFATRCPMLATYDQSNDMRIIGRLYDAFGATEVIEIFDQAYAQRESLATERFPKFTLNTVEFYARYKYVAKPKVEIPTAEKLVKDHTRNGTLNEIELAKYCAMYGVQVEYLHGHVSDEAWTRLRDKIPHFVSIIRSRNTAKVS